MTCTGSSRLNNEQCYTMFKIQRRLRSLSKPFTCVFVRLCVRLCVCHLF
jgi:hypothetical protein